MAPLKRSSVPRPGSPRLVLSAAALAACRLAFASRGVHPEQGQPLFPLSFAGFHNVNGLQPHGCHALRSQAKRPVRGSSTVGAFGPWGEAADLATAALPVSEAALRVFLGFISIYVIMSANEYVYHRYFQHLGINKLDPARFVRSSLGLETYRGDGHVEHHKETLDDMSLTYTAKLLDEYEFRGTVFSWSATVYMTLSVLVPAYPILSALGWSGPAIVLVVTASLLLHALIWNALHPHMHGLPDVPLEHGAPSGVLAGYRDSELFRWLRRNHEGHHRAEGAHGNYNVCCPLVDQLVGTYVGHLPAAEAKLEQKDTLGSRVVLP